MLNEILWSSTLWVIAKSTLSKHSLYDRLIAHNIPYPSIAPLLNACSNSVALLTKHSLICTPLRPPCPWGFNSHFKRCYEVSPIFFPSYFSSGVTALQLVRFPACASKIFWSQKCRSKSFNWEDSLSIIPYRAKPHQTNVTKFFGGDEKIDRQKLWSNKKFVLKKF